MFIPMWLLVVIVLVIVLSVPAARDLLATFLLLATVLVVAASGFAALYFFASKQITLALIWGAPFLAVMAWFAISESVKVWDSSGKLNSLALRAYMAFGNTSSGSAEAIRQSRQKLAERTQLGYRLFKFYDNIKYFPSWYARAADNPEVWEGSRVIARTDFATLSKEERQQLGFDASRKRSDGLLVYRFSSEHRTFFFCAEAADVPTWHDDHDGFYGAHRFHVIEPPATTVLKILVVEKCGEYGDSYASMHLEAFRPGPWLRDLLHIAEQVHIENEQRAEASRKRMDEKRVRENFL